MSNLLIGGAILYLLANKIDVVKKSSKDKLYGQKDGEFPGTTYVRDDKLLYSEFYPQGREKVDHLVQSEVGNQYVIKGYSKDTLPAEFTTYAYGRRNDMPGSYTSLFKQTDENKLISTWRDK